MQIQPNVQRPSVVVWSDVDRSMVGDNPDAVAESRELLVDSRRDTLVGFCTGRGVSSAQHQAPVLAGFPLQVYALNNGQNIYWNPDGVEASEFIRTLGQRPEDPDWAAHVRAAAGRWDRDLVRSTMLDTLQSQGYRATDTRLPGHYAPLTELVGPQGTCWLSPDQPTFYVIHPQGSWAGPAQSEMAETLSAAIRDHMAETGMQAVYLVEPPKGRGVMTTFSPPGIDKQAALQYVLSKYPSARAAITIGDTVNDRHIEPVSYGTVPNYPILAGSWHPDRQRLTTHPRMLLTPGGEVAPALAQHLGNINP